MTRALLMVIACLALTGCWISDTRIFGDGDWAHLDLNGKYKSKNGNGEEQAGVVLKSRPNGLIEATSTRKKDGKIENSVLGLVRIAGGSGNYFLAVDRSDASGGGEIYLIAHLTDNHGLDVYWPDCGGTSPVSGMTSEADDLTHTKVCKFTSKAALMAAGLQAEKFLEAKHVVEINPFGKLEPDTGSSDDSEDASN